jgi:hypothetical protein
VNLAESIQFSGPEVAMILLMLLGLVLAVGGTIVAGCIFAHKAGRGSERALVWWGVIAALEVGLLVFAVNAGGVVVPGLILGGALLIQAALYASGRTNSSS